MSDELDKVCRILDKLTIDSLTLMEEGIELKVNAEKAMCGGETNLAKSRYILGQNSVSALQLPTEQSAEFEAILKVATENDDGKKTLILEQKQPADIVMQNPIKWFGILVPQTLHVAQDMYQRATQWIVNAANIHLLLIDTCNKIKLLREYKLELINSKV